MQADTISMPDVSTTPRSMLAAVMATPGQVGPLAAEFGRLGGRDPNLPPKAPPARAFEFPLPPAAGVSVARKEHQRRGAAPKDPARTDLRLRDDADHAKLQAGHERALRHSSAGHDKGSQGRGNPDRSRSSGQKGQDEQWAEGRVPLGTREEGSA